MDNILHTLVGTWFICATNFPMWLKGNKTHPTFHYSLVAHKERTLLDEVKYLQNGKSKTITGYDTQDSSDPMAFVWRGKGLLRLLKSKWKVALIDPSGQWAVIWFSKTLFTPEGVDVISRTPALSSTDLVKIKTQMAKDSLLAPHLESLKPL
jgi:Lipocalin-like domain